MASSSERRSSVTSQHSAHSVPRLSLDKRYSTDRRSSTDSTIRTPLPNMPGISSLPGISSNSPLAPTGPRGMPPPTPAKDRLPPPQTPTRKPVQRQKSPLSSEAFSSASPPPSMPGTFPSTPPPGLPVGLPPTQASPTAYVGNHSSVAAASPSSANKGRGKRTSSLREFLPFKTLRKSYEQTSPDPSPPQNGPPRPSSAFGMRPTTPGADSMLSKSTNQSSLRKKMSGSFWRRKSGALGVGGGGGDDGASMDTNRDGSVATSGNETLVGDGGRSATPVPGEDEAGGVLKVTKRKSGTFWRRRSSADLLDQYSGTNGAGHDVPAAKTNGYSDGQTNGHGIGDEDVVMGGTDEHMGYENGDANGVTSANVLTRPRSISPPPQLPEIIGSGGGLGLEPENMFQDI